MNWTFGTALTSCALVGAAACVDLGHSCAAVGADCNRTTILVQSPGDTWTAGAYVVALDIDGKAVRCTIQVPDSPPITGVQADCGLATSVTLKMSVVQSCPPVVCGSTTCVGMGCSPIPGRFQLTLLIESLPSQVGLDLSLEGVRLTSETIAPKQTTTEPNGAGCGTCTNALATLTLAGG